MLGSIMAPSTAAVAAKSFPPSPEYPKPPTLPPAVTDGSLVKLIETSPPGGTAQIDGLFSQVPFEWHQKMANCSVGKLTPASAAVQALRPDILQYLIDKGATLFLGSGDGTILHKVAALDAASFVYNLIGEPSFKQLLTDVGAPQEAFRIVLDGLYDQLPCCNTAAISGAAATQQVTIKDVVNELQARVAKIVEITLDSFGEDQQALIRFLNTRDSSNRTMLHAATALIVPHHIAAEVPYTPPFTGSPPKADVIRYSLLADLSMAIKEDFIKSVLGRIIRLSGPMPGCSCYENSAGTADNAQEFLVNAKDYTGGTPLRNAILYNFEGAQVLLVEHGANVLLPITGSGRELSAGPMTLSRFLSGAAAELLETMQSVAAAGDEYSDNHAPKRGFFRRLFGG